MQNTGTLEWQDGQPVSSAFGDIYFSRDSGIDETRHVFLRHNDLERRWRNPDGRLFTIGETGFGTGLNFLCAWQLWNACATQGQRLHFVSTEKFPLTLAELQQALALWPELEPLGTQLLRQYASIAPGWRRMTFDDGRVMLTLLVGDARETLPALRARINAWFLDGFAPARNPEMWQPDLLQEIARLTAPGGTFATFTSASPVRRGLESAGFSVKKVAGFGSKRDMLCGSMSQQPQPVLERDRRAIVIGSGIAGTASAFSLAQRGWQVTLIERHDRLAAEASGNPQGVLYPRLSGHDIPLGRVALHGFLHTLSLLRRLLEKHADWDDCGLLQQAFNARETKRCEEVLARGLPLDLVRGVDAFEAAGLTGIAMPYGGLWFPAGGWVHPPALCRALAAQNGIRIVTSNEALHLQCGIGGWQVWGHGECLAEAPVTVLAGANDIVRFEQSAHLPLEPVRGQITVLPATAESSRLKAVVCTDGYISPMRQGRHCAGASFAPEDRGMEVRIRDHEQNLAMLKHLSPPLHRTLGTSSPETLQGRVSLRCATPDYLPMAGPLLDAALLLERFSPGSRLTEEHLPWLEGLYVNTGHGSKGLLTAPLCGEIIAAMLEDEPLPVDVALARALDPNRFLLRERGLKRLIGVALG